MTHTLLPSEYFPHERLAAYGYALRAVEFVAGKQEKLRGLPGGAGPQLERAVVGALTNLCAGATAEGAEQRRHYRIARSEAGEAGGAIDVARAFGAFTAEEHAEVRGVLLRLCACLRGLARQGLPVGEPR